MCKQINHCNNTNNCCDYFANCFYHLFTPIHFLNAYHNTIRYNHQTTLSHFLFHCSSPNCLYSYQYQTAVIAQFTTSAFMNAILIILSLELLRQLHKCLNNHLLLREIYSADLLHYPHDM